ncbi:MAG: glycosyltransferase family 4 protein [Actinomycetes bacterium]
MTKPVLLVTNQVPPDRAGALAELNNAEVIKIAIYDGKQHHGSAGLEDPGVPFIRSSQQGIYRLAASGRYRAVIATSAGRIALPAAYAGARRAGVPFIYWTGIWHQISTPLHLAAAPLVRWIESHSDAVIAYGPHVAEYVKAHGAKNVHVAPQPVDVGFWSQPGRAAAWRQQLGEPSLVVGVAGRSGVDKGVSVAVKAWQRCGLAAQGAMLVIAGSDDGSQSDQPSIRALGELSAGQMRDLYAAADIWLVPSLATRAFREPWGLVVNEAMLQGTAVISSDAVGAAAGGLVNDRKTGLVVMAGNEAELATAIQSLERDPSLRLKLAAAGTNAAERYDYSAWAAGCSAALESVSAGRSAC